MIIRIKKNSDVPSSEITPESAYIDRRKFLGASAFIGRGLAAEQGTARTGGPRGLAVRPAAQDEEPNTLGRDHELQQLLRIRPRQEGSVEIRPQPPRDPNRGP